MHGPRILAFLLLLAAAVAPLGPARAAGGIGTMAGVFIGADPARGTVRLALPAPFRDTTLSIADPAAKPLLAAARAGDLVTFIADDSTHPTRLRGLEEIRRPVAKGPRAIALGGSLALICLLAAALARDSPLVFLVGPDNRYSNSQTQLALWFAALATVYLATLILRALYLGADYIGGVQITSNLLGITGLSAFSFGGAKVITTQKVQNAGQAALQAKPRATRARISDLVRNDRNQADLGDLEMILITLAAIGIFVLSGFHFLGALQLAPRVTLPDVDSTVLASFGIGHGAYLAKKAALGLGEG